MSPSSQILLVFVVGLIFYSQGAPLNDRPIIGILTEPCTTFQFGEEFIEATYVRYLEMAGARVVPIRGKQSQDYYEQVFKNINGALFPGGGANIDSGPFHDAGNYIYNLAVKANDDGDYFPIWGTCLGFELLTVLTAQKNFLQHTDTENMTLPLRFEKGFERSRMFSKLSPDVFKYLSSEPVTQNNHQYSLLVQDYQNISALNEFYRLLSTNVDPDGKEFVSTVEAYHYPFYGTQWHPEKNVFLWRTDQAINHDEHAVKISQYMGDFFVNEARRSSHHYNSTDAEAHAVIENFYREFYPDFKKGEIFYFNYTYPPLKDPVIG